MQQAHQDYQELKERQLAARKLEEEEFRQQVQADHWVVHMRIVQTTGTGRPLGSAYEDSSDNRYRPTIG